MATNDGRESLLDMSRSHDMGSIDSRSGADNFPSFPEYDDIERTKQCMRNLREIERRMAKLKKMEKPDADAILKTMLACTTFRQNPEMELPRAFDADDLEKELFVEPMPIIYPPEDWASKKHMRWDYSELPTSTSIRLLKLRLLDDYESWEDGESRNPKKYSPIQCSMDVVDLADEPDFFALSYTWGDPRTIYLDKAEIMQPEAWHAPSFELDCDGKPVTVTANLYNALIALRSAWSGTDFVLEMGPYYVPQKGDRSQIYIWIDQLCINQGDIAEKNVQVPMMDRIYQEARATIMWLGGGERLATGGTINTIQGVKAVIQKFREMFDNDDDNKDSGSKPSKIWRNSERVQKACSTFDVRKEESYTALGVEPIEPEALIGFYLMFSRSWFQRAWIVQEWALSEHCAFLCGGMAFPQRAVLDLMQHFWQVGWFGQIENLVRDNLLDHNTGGVPSWNKTPSPFHRALHEPRWGNKPRDTMPVLYRPPWANIDPASRSSISFTIVRAIRMRMGFDSASACSDEWRKKLRDTFAISLESFRQTQATDPRDKVFAFYSLFKDDEGTPVYPLPDYSKTVRQVYVKATITMAKQFGPRFLSFLGRKDYTSEQHDLPSWVPDLSRGTSGTMQICPSGFEWYDASTGLASPVSVDLLSEDMLLLSGCYIDTISQVQEEPLGACNLVFGFRELHQILCRLPELSEIYTPNGDMKEQSRYEVYWRTKIKDYIAKAPDYPPAELGRVHFQRLQRFLTGQITHTVFHVVKQNIDQVLEEAKTSSSPNLFLSECSNKLSAADSDDCSIKYHCEEMIKEGHRQYETDIHEFDIERHGQAIIVINTYLSMFKGDISFDDYEGVIPAMWVDCLEAFEELTEARHSQDYMRFRDSLSYLLYDLPPKLVDVDEAYADMLEGHFRDNDYFFATQGGRLGQNPGGAEVGDEIWVLAGLHAPIVLRRLDDGQHRVVGCAYVHGMMHGQAVVGKELEVVHLV